MILTCIVMLPEQVLQGRRDGEGQAVRRRRQQDGSADECLEFLPAAGALLATHTAIYCIVVVVLRSADRVPCSFSPSHVNVKVLSLQQTD